MRATEFTSFRSSLGVRSEHGFSLVELAVAIFVIALLVGSILVPLTMQVEQRQISETQKMIEDIKEALLGFAVANGRLPCPDKTSGSVSGANNSPNDGVEDYDSTNCIVYLSGGTVSVGNVPWVTLGIGSVDVWGNRFHYFVSPEFARRPPNTFNLSSVATARVCPNAACAIPLTLTNPNGAVAVILSYGKNGRGAINTITGTANPAPTSTDELEHTDSGVNYVSRAMTPVGSAAGEFDDIVTWLGKYTLFNRMISAGKLP